MGNYSLGEAVLGTKVDLTGLGQGLSQAESKTRSAVGAFGGFLGTALGTVTGIIGGQILGAVGGALGNIKDAMIGGNAEFERYNVQFGVLLGSADAAQQRIDELAEFGARTPFELPEVVRADKVLQAFGLHAEDAAQRFGFSGEQIRTIAGDAAAGTGASFEEISTYLGKFASGATGEAISRMQELGIVTRQQLSDMGLEFSKSGQLMSPIDESMQVILTAVQDKFGGMMDAQSGTFEGMMSNLQDWMGQAGRVLGQPIFEILKDKLGSLLQFLGSDDVKGALTFFADQVGQTLNVIIGGIESLLSGDLTEALDGLGELDWFRAIKDQLGITGEEFYTFTAKAGEVVAQIQSLAAEFSAALSSAMSSPAVQALGQALTELGAAAGNAWEQISAAFGQIGAQTNATFPSIQEIVVGVVSVVAWWLTSIANHITTFVLPTLVAIVQWVAANWPQIQATAAQVFGEVQAIVSAVVAFFATVVIPAAQQLVQWIVDHWPQIQAITSAVFNQVSSIVGSVMAVIRSVITTVLGAIQTFWNAWGGKIKAFTDEWFESIGHIFNAFAKAFKGDWEGFGKDIRKAWDNSWEAIGKAFDAAIKAILEMDWGKLGQDIIKGIADGITASVKWIQEAATSAVDAALRAAKGFLGIESPSFEARIQVGQPFGQGIVRGILDLVPDIRNVSSFAGQMALAGASSSVTNSTTFNASYAYRDEVSLMDDVRFYDLVRGVD
ncbi:MAG TPA: hypothetical protein PLC98_05185 [Anaerolineales bacterium]|nr:hypothetical protein [Anaerolineales bacterium]